MPVTKKKGAIFAIHADTPDKSTSTISAVRSPTKSKPNTLGRKALAVKQATQPQPRGFPSSSALSRSHGSGIDTDDLVKPSKDVYATSTGKTNIAKVPRKPLMEKRNRRGASPSFDENTPPITTTTIVNASGKSVRTPAKKARVTDRTPVRGPAAALQDGDDTGSPASRTRSKTRLDSPTTTTAVLGLGSTSKPRTRRPTISSALAGGSGTTRKLTGSGTRMDVFEDVENIPPSLPISRQVVDRKRGKDILDLLGRAGSEGPEEADMAEYEKKYEEHMTQKRGGGSSKVALKDLGMGLGKGRAVLGDMPLADVSEAYGAIGSEPRGFKEQ